MTSHWDRVGATYDDEWRAPAKQELSRSELDFVLRALARSPGGHVLDVGIGTGRILGALLADDRVTRATGIDASPVMVDACRQRFADDEKLHAIEVRDVARDGPPEPAAFAFVSAIRVLKYQATWEEVVGRLVASLVPGGVLAFTMPNRFSLNALSRRYAVAWHATTHARLVGLAHDLGVELLELTAFTKLPFFAYSRATGPRTSRVPLLVDRALGRVLGDRRLGRELFVAVRVPTPPAPPPRRPG